MSILDSVTFKRVMYFKFFMVIVVWGIFPLLVPVSAIPFFGLHLNNFQISLLRLWGSIVLLDSFLYMYIYKRPHARLTKYLLLFGVLDNGVLGIVVLILSLVFSLPWGIWINVPFQLFFGYWFWKFYKHGFSKLKHK